MSINCEILDLRAFLGVVELESFHRAAEVLNLSQPALSRRIQKLEASIGARLLERTTRQVSPTALGLELLPLVRRMIEEFDGSLFAARDRGLRRSELVTIACLPTAAFYFLPTVIKQFNAEYPDIRFRILDLTATEALAAVSRGEVEFGINFMGTSDPDLIFDRIAEDPFVLAARRDHPLAQKKVVGWADLAPYRLITVHRSSGNRTMLDAALARANIELRWSYEVTHLSTSLGLVEAGLGISILPRTATPGPDHPFIVSRPLESPTISRTIGLVRRRAATLSPAAERFRRMIMGAWRADGPEEELSA